jgi:transposase InsO family protein
MAVARINPPRGMAQHSDLAVQYGWRECRDLSTEHGLTQGMRRFGNRYYTEMMESFRTTLSKELLHARRFRMHEEARPPAFR